MVGNGVDGRPQVRSESDADFIANRLVSEYQAKQDAIDNAKIDVNPKRSRKVAEAEFELKKFEYSIIELLIESKEARRAFKKEFSEKLKTHDFKNKDTQVENQLMGWLIKIAAVAAVYAAAMTDGQNVEFPPIEDRSAGHFDILINSRRYVIAAEKLAPYNVHWSRRNQSFWHPRGSQKDRLDQRVMERFSRCEQADKQRLPFQHAMLKIPPVALQINPRTIIFSSIGGFSLVSPAPQPEQSHSHPSPTQRLQHFR